MQKFLRMNCVFTTMMNISVISNLFGDSGVLSLCVWRETRRPYFVCNDNRISLILSARNRTLVQCTHIHTKESTNEHRKRGKLARNPRIASAKRPNEKTFCAVARRKKKKTPKGDWILLWVCMRMNECAIYISHRISIIFDSKLWPRYSFAFTFSFVLIFSRWVRLVMVAGRLFSFSKHHIIHIQTQTRRWNKSLLRILFIFHFIEPYLWIFLLFILIPFFKNMQANWFDIFRLVAFHTHQCATYKFNGEMMMIAWVLPFNLPRTHTQIYVFRADPHRFCLDADSMHRRKMNYKHLAECFFATNVSMIIVMIMAWERYIWMCVCVYAESEWATMNWNVNNMKPAVDINGFINVCHEVDERESCTLFELRNRYQFSFICDWDWWVSYPVIRVRYTSIT